MANNKSNVKTNAKMDELVAIEKSPELTEYIIRTKIKDVRKTAMIIGVIVAFVTFACGFMVGFGMAAKSVPQNVIEVRVDSQNATADTEGK